MFCGLHNLISSNEFFHGEFGVLLKKYPKSLKNCIKANEKQFESTFVFYRLTQITIGNVSSVTLIKTS